MVLEEFASNITVDSACKFYDDCSTIATWIYNALPLLNGSTLFSCSTCLDMSGV